MTITPKTAANPKPLHSFTKVIAPILGGGVIAIVASVLLGLLAYALICCGLSPQSTDIADTVGPLLGVVYGGVWAVTRMQRPAWVAGLGVGLVMVALWFIAWCYLVGRIDPGLWWRQGVLGLTPIHLTAWLWTLLAGAAGGAIGSWMKQQKTRWAKPGLGGILMLGLAAAMVMSGRMIDAKESPFGQELTLLPGMQVRREPTYPDGTIVRVLTFDLAAQPQLHLGLYDADSDDANPFNNANATWLGQNLDFVLAKLRARAHQRNREIFCLFNADFFGGTGDRIATHEAPIVVNGKPLYNINILKEKWPDQAWVFGINYQAGQPRLHLIESVPWQQLHQFETALSGVRPLRVAGKSLKLAPGTGGTSLRCSRTSLGWTADSKHLFLLSVRDPDGEAASIRQRRSGRPQTGGWDVHQVQQFWERQHIPYALLLDGGESTQLAYRHADNDYISYTAAYHLKWTWGYLRARPLRVFLPLLPAAQNRGGVLNYLYIDGPAQL